MIRWAIIFATLVLTFTVAAFAAQKDINAGISISDGQVKNFYLAIGEQYRVPQKEIFAVHERNIPDEDLPVVYFLAKRAHVRPSAIVEMRLAGKSWWDITLRYHLGADIYYVPVRGALGHPAARAFTHYRRPKAEWKHIVLNDDDIITLVNTRFINDRYGYPREDVVRWRTEGRTFVVINDDVRKIKENHRDNHAEKNEKAEKENKHDQRNKESR
jgi:hypothetical protein